MNAEPDKLPPEPEVTGVKPVQLKSSSDEWASKTEGASPGGIGHYPLTEAIREISEGGVRGQAGMLLLYASTQRLESDLLTVRQERDSAFTELNKLRERFFEKKEAVEVLKERIVSFKQNRLAQNIMITLGGIVGGNAVTFFRSDNVGWPLAAIVLGAGLLFCGWFGCNDKRKEVE
ncbi:MAG: hypothetical protein AB1461_11540 [Thermodesulfobacteriota bacterium]